MNRLSTELINEIIQLLPQEDKVECMLVCKFWHSIIESLLLYQIVRVSTSTNLDILTKKLQQKPENRSKVEHLIIDIIYEEQVQLDILLSLLPNLRTFHSPNYKNNPVTTTKPDQYPWQKTIQCVTESSHEPIILRILNLGPCPNLRTLTVSDYDEILAPLLNHAPSLRSLTLGIRFIHLRYLESIHQHAPLLESFQLKPLFVHGDGNDIDPISVTAALKMTQFSLDIIDPMDTNIKINLLNYVTKKYPHLTTFHLFNHDFVYNIPEKEKEHLCIYGWKPLLTSLRRLKNIYTDHTIVPGNLLDLLNDAGSQHIHRLYLKNSILNNIGQLQFNHQVYHSLLRLELNIINCSTFDWLKQFKQLLKLKLIHITYEQSPTINLNNLFENCPPTLKSITFKYTDIAFNLSSPLNISSCPLSITKLSFHDITLPDRIDAFISKHLHYISKLKFKRCELNNKKRMEFPDCDIYRFQIQDHFTEVDRAILVKTTENEQQRWFTTTYIESRQDGSKEYNGIPVQHQAVKSRIVKDEEKMDAAPFFVLVCRSLNNIVIKDTLNC